MTDHNPTAARATLPPTFRIVDHVDGGKCLLDTSTFEYFRLPDTKADDHWWAVFGEKKFPFFDTIKQFLESEIQKAIIPAFCIERKIVKKRAKVTVLNGLDTFIFWSVEMIAGKWERNEIEAIEPNGAYWLFVEKNLNAECGMIVRSAKRIERHTANG